MGGCNPDWIQVWHQHVSPRQRSGTLKAWALIPELIEESVGDLDEEHLDLRREQGGCSVRETVHHLVEAHVVASSIVIAALGSSGCTYDWSWLQPGGSWIARLGYSTLPLGPSIEALRTLNKYVALLVAPAEDALQRVVNLRDAPSADLRSMSVDHPGTTRCPEFLCLLRALLASG